MVLGDTFIFRRSLCYYVFLNSLIAVVSGSDFPCFHYSNETKGGRRREGARAEAFLSITSVIDFSILLLISCVQTGFGDERLDLCRVRGEIFLKHLTAAGDCKLGHN